MSKIEKLRGFMRKNNIDTYVISKLDPHNSEIGPLYFNGVRYISGFKGSNGLVVITQKEACLWTDGRYFIQAADEIQGTEIILQKQGEPGYPDYLSYIFENTKENGVIGFDGRTFMANQISEMIEKIDVKNITLSYDKDLLEEIWSDRPKLSDNKIFEHEVKYTGKSRTDKISKIKKVMVDEKIDYYFIAALDDIAWLFNLRGSDVYTNTTFASYALINHEEIILFTDLSKASDVKEILKKDNIKLLPYEEIFHYLGKIDKEKVLGVNLDNTNYLLYNGIKNLNIKQLKLDITSQHKAIKNPIEIENIRNVNIRDGVHLLRAIKYVKENYDKINMNECHVSDKVTYFRSQDENYFSNSFETIAALGSNGAIMHYRPEEKTCKKIEKDNFLLIDSGGQYFDGTTDITRTIVLGKISDEMKKHFTLVLKSNIALATAVFLEDTAGIQLDMFARKIMWDNHMDYKSGTGHGIGYFLNVHEGPQSISRREIFAPVQVGMLFSNEPGVYRENKYGIRTETTVVVQEEISNEYGNFFSLETVTYFPIDIKAIDVSLLDDKELDWINNYHQEVYAKLSPSLNDEEKEFLKKETIKLVK